MKYPCWNCTGEGCDTCEGTGEIEGPYASAWIRRKRYLGTRHPLADKNGNEKFVTMSAEIPPEFLPLLREIHRVRMGVNYNPKAPNAGIVRSALFMYLKENLPEGEKAIEGEAEVIDAEFLELPAGDEA